MKSIRLKRWLFLGVVLIPAGFIVGVLGSIFAYSRGFAPTHQNIAAIRGWESAGMLIVCIGGSLVVAALVVNFFVMPPAQKPDDTP